MNYSSTKEQTNKKFYVFLRLGFGDRLVRWYNVSFILQILLMALLWQRGQTHWIYPAFAVFAVMFLWWANSVIFNHFTDDESEELRMLRKKGLSDVPK